MYFTSRSKSFPYLYRGVVKVNNDPKSLGRCKIHIPDLYGKDDYDVNMLPWARPITPTSYTGSRGSFALPDIGDIVWVFLEGGHKSAPVYLGGTIGTGDSLVNLDEVILYREEESTLSYDRISKKFTIRVKDTILEISEEGVLMNGLSMPGGDSDNITGIQYEILEVIDDVHTR